MAMTPKTCILEITQMRSRKMKPFWGNYYFIEIPIAKNETTAEVERFQISKSSNFEVDGIFKK